VKIIAACWLLAVRGMAVLCLPSPLLASEIAVLKSADIPAYNQAIAAFKSDLPATATITVYDLQGDVAKGRSLARKLRATDVSLVLAVGLKAALVAKLELPDIPVVFCMVLDPAKHDLKASNIAGILLETPIDRQFSAIRTVLPSAKRIGVLFDPDKTAHLVEEARQRAKALGLELVARQVTSEKEVPVTLRALTPSIEALWLLPDSTVLNEESLKFILNTALEASVPVIGFSRDLVRSGALAGLYVTYDDVGHQAGLLAKKILSGQDFSSIAVVSPDRPRLALNLKTAKFLGIPIPPDVVNRADEVY
jgi:putative ABC transport system substrate-binding protein